MTNEPASVLAWAPHLFLRFILPFCEIFSTIATLPVVLIRQNFLQIPYTLVLSFPLTEIIGPLSPHICSPPLCPTSVPCLQNPPPNAIVRPFVLHFPQKDFPMERILRRQRSTFTLTTSFPSVGKRSIFVCFCGSEAFALT